MEDDILIGPGVKIWSQNHKYIKKNTSINEQGWNYEEVVIGSDVWLSTDVVVLPGSIIPNGTVIGAGSVVTRKMSLEPYGVYAGKPLKKIGERRDEPDTPT